jgi:hypothetical protein
MKKTKSPTIRFMMPMDIQCTPCTQNIKKGKIVKAEKQQMTERSPDCSFNFKCPNCDSSLEIHSDSVNQNYYTYLNCVETTGE